jgi:acetyl esterase/lipase
LKSILFFFFFKFNHKKLEIMKKMTKDEVDPELRKYIISIPNWFITNSFGRKISYILRRLLLKNKKNNNVKINEICLNNGLELRIYLPINLKSSAGLLWIHGGGMVTGDPKDTDILMIDTADQLGITIVAPRYRHAPENPFPAHLDDCFSTWQWMLDPKCGLSLDKNKIAVGGLSAGGGLAACLVHKIYDLNGVMPVAQWLFCPMLDDRTATLKNLDSIKHYVWNNKLNRFGWSSYLGTDFGTSSVPQYAVPARRENLSGLPPAWIGIGNIDLFYEEDRKYAQRLQKAGVEVTFIEVPNAFHGFEIIGNETGLAQKFLGESKQWLKKHLDIN